MKQFWTITGPYTNRYCTSLKYNPIECLKKARVAWLTFPEWNAEYYDDETNELTFPDTYKCWTWMICCLRKRAIEMETSIAERRHEKVANVTWDGMTGVPFDRRKIDMETVVGLLKAPYRLQPAHVKEVLEYLFGPARATPTAYSPLRIHKQHSVTWRTNMPWACEWEKDAMKLLLREEWRRLKYSREYEAEQTWMPGDDDLPQAEDDAWGKSPPRNILLWYGACE